MKFSSTDLLTIPKLENATAFLKCTLISFLVVLITACQQVPLQSNDTGTTSYSRVTSDVLPSLFDKKLFIDGNYMIVSADYTFAGMWNGEPMAGTWEMKNEYFCRVLTQFFKLENTGGEDCQVWEISGDKIRGTRNKGNGSSFTYMIK